MRMMRGLVLLLAACGSGVEHDPTHVEVVTDALAAVGPLAQDSTNLYVVEQLSANNLIVSVPKAGGTPVQIASGGAIGGIAADDAGVYWLDFDGRDERVMALAHGSSTPVELGRSTNGINGAGFSMAQDATMLYFADEAGAVWRVPKAGGGATQIGMTDTTIAPVVADATGVWVATRDGAKHLPTGNELPFLVASTPAALAIDGDTLFAIDAGTGAADGAVYAVSSIGHVDTLASSLILPVDLAAADGTLYVATNNEDSAIRELPETGGGSTVIAGNQQPVAVIVDASYVYWTGRIGHLHKVAR
jgi:hypothetical protein